MLPAWRGAAPVQRAILHGDEVTGATTFELVPELDAGPVYGVLTEPVREFDTAGELLQRLSVSGAELLVATLDGIESGELTARPQPADGVTVAPKLSKSDARVSWKLPALAIDRQIRACTPAPGGWTTWDGLSLKVWPVRRVGAADLAGADIGAGEVRAVGGRILVGTGTTAVQLSDVQQEGKRRMAAADWLRGVANTGKPLVFD